MIFDQDEDPHEPRYISLRRDRDPHPRCLDAHPRCLNAKSLSLGHWLGFYIVLPLFLSPLSPKSLLSSPSTCNSAWAKTMTPHAASPHTVPPHSAPRSPQRRTSIFKPDALGIRAIYGRSQTLDHTESGQVTSPLYGSALSVEWGLLHHHLEIEIIFGGVVHEQMMEEFGECVLKLPLLHLSHLELLIGAGAIIETHHHIPQAGVTYDINTRFWASEHWGISAEFDYVWLNSNTESYEGIAEILYRF